MYFPSMRDIALSFWAKASSGIRQEEQRSRILQGSLMHRCRHFDHFLKSRDDSGVVIVDSRRKAQNREAAHSIFTQLHERYGSAFPSLPQDIAFSPSNNSAMIQMADIVCSALVFSMIADAYITCIFSKQGTSTIAPRISMSACATRTG